MPSLTVPLHLITPHVPKNRDLPTFAFDLGIELDDETPTHAKFDIPANRIDLLCTEGLVAAMKRFQGTYVPLATTKQGEGKKVTIIVRKETQQIRKFVVGAVLRGVTFTQENYDSFIDLQDKLHTNIARKRTLVAIGTHDLDTIESPFTYEALTPESIEFAPLTVDTKMNGKQIMQHYKSDKRLSKFLKIIEDSPVYPVIYDAQRRVLSLPPIINSWHSKLSLKTRNVFIECTGTDLTKTKIVLNTMVAMFAEYCSERFVVETVDVKVEGKTFTYPDLTPRTTTASVPYINSCTGLSLNAQAMCDLLKKMSLTANCIDPDTIQVQVPVTRSDILHECDIMEDVAIAYGYNSLPRRFPQTMSLGKQLPINSLTDKVRREIAGCGWSEVIPFILCSIDENDKFLRNPPSAKDTVVLANPRTIDYQVVRTSLLSGLLKTMHSNLHEAHPICIYEVSDVVLKDEKQSRKARNERHVAGVWGGKEGGFEQVHGIIDRLMVVMEAPNYTIKESSFPTFLPGRCADILIDNKCIGHFGVVHPETLNYFEIPFVCCAFEFNLETFM